MGGRSSVSGLKVTVFGATGFTGRYIVNKLGQIGSQIAIPYRGDEYDMMHLKPLADLGRISSQHFSLRDYDGILSAVKYSDVVINLIAQDRETRNFKFKDVHVQGPLTIAKACREAGVSRFIHVSSALASTDALSRISQSKAEGEEALRSEYPQSVIVRPSVMFGHEDRFLRALGTFSALPLGYPLVGHGRALRHPLYVGDFAEAMLRLVGLNADLVAGRTFDLFGPRQYSIAEIVRLFCYFACRPHQTLQLPPFLLNLYARLNPEWRRFLFTRELIKQMTEDEVHVEGAGSWADLGMNVADLKTLERDALPFIRPFRQIQDFSRILPPLQPASEAPQIESKSAKVK